MWGKVDVLKVVIETFNPLRANPTNWSNTLNSSAIADKFPTNCLSAFDHLAGLEHKGFRDLYQLNNHPLIRDFLGIIFCHFIWRVWRLSVNILLFTRTKVNSQTITISEAQNTAMMLTGIWTVYNEKKLVHCTRKLKPVTFLVLPILSICKYCMILPQEYSDSCQTTKMGCFAKIFNS